MKKLIALLAMMASPLAAQDFSEGSEARSWNLYAEVPAKFEATVVDLLCTFTGDCPADCGAGKRQLGLLRTADDMLILPMKNSQPAFTGAAVELQPFCNQTITVDGLMIDDPELGANNVYLVQTIVPPGGGDKIKANKWTKNWAAEHPEAKGKGPWFRRDPRIKSIIAEEGYLGLGVELDEAWIADNF
ncbi:hypothetical protein [uncultured Tateyamaria sp.]|uniref:hypothetical protein n=1 Tax=uncultured Tateyamaria sp. TaxID=455651 RepID=UPI002624D3A8|nr:hypothetical protein [uncultured Tateyamaria sp.]